MKLTAQETIHEELGAPLIGVLQRDVTWGDCDPAGIVYYPTYYRWIDASTWNLFFLSGFTAQSIRSEYPNQDTPVVACGLEFHNPALFGDKAEVRTFVEHWSGKSFKMHHEIVRADGVRIAHGTEVRVWVENNAGAIRAAPVPESFKQRFFVKR